MTNNTQHFKELLEQEATTLTEELKTIGVQSTSNPDDWKPTSGGIDSDAIDPNEAADAIEELETNTGISNELEARLKNVHDALARIEQGEYGVCSVCNKEIEEARLEANPAASTCIEHKDN